MPSEALHNVRYRIEYLAESTDERSVCRTALGEGSLADATEEAWRRAFEIDGATGFQIRDLEDDACIVSLEYFYDRRVWH